MKKIIVFLFFVLVFASSISAVQDIQVIQGTVEGLIIEYPKFEFLQYGKNFTLNIHVFNESNGVAMTQQTTNCTLHGYSSDGTHLIEQYMDYNTTDKEWKIFVDSGNATYTGKFGYIIQCNTSQGGQHFGGAASGVLLVTPTGQEQRDNTDRIVPLIILAGIFILVGVIVWANGRQANREEQND